MHNIRGPVHAKSRLGPVEVDTPALGIDDQKPPIGRKCDGLDRNRVRISEVRQSDIVGHGETPLRAGQGRCRWPHSGGQ